MKKHILYGGGAIALLLTVSFAYYAISPLFRHIVVDESVPGSEKAMTEDMKKSEDMEGEMKKDAMDTDMEDGGEAGTETMKKEMTGEASEVMEKSPAPAAAVVGTVGHPASGSVRVVEAGGETFIRYENYKTINGPDLFVYLAKDLDAQEFVSLGELRATEGNVNYQVPDDIDVREYPYVLTWCKQFGVLFNHAKLSS